MCPTLPVTAPPVQRRDKQTEENSTNQPIEMQTRSTRRVPSAATKTIQVAEAKSNKKAPSNKATTSSQQEAKDKNNKVAGPSEPALVFGVIEHTDGSDCGVTLFRRYDCAAQYAQKALNTLVRNLSGTGTAINTTSRKFTDKSGQELELQEWHEEGYEKSRHILMTAEYVAD